MAQPTIRKKPTGYAAHAPITLSDDEQCVSRNDDEQQRRDSQWISPSKDPQQHIAEQRPTSCFGHFDRLDVEYTPKPTTKPRIIVYRNEGSLAEWASRPPLHAPSRSVGTARLGLGGGVSEVHARASCLNGDGDVVMSGGLGDGTSMFADNRLVDPGQLGLEDETQAMSDEEGLTTIHNVDSIELSTEDADGYAEAAEPSQEQEQEQEPTSPRSTLMALRVPPTAQPLSITQDPYFAGRLAATSLIMLRDGLGVEARQLGQWSVNLVGEEEWDKMVEYHGSAGAGEDDDWHWMAFMLGEVDINLRQVDESKAEELRAMMREWQENGVLPSD